jgi:hypothetical protein
MSSPLPPLPPVPRSPAVSVANPAAELRRHLTLLSIFHFVHAGFSLFLLIIPLYLLFFGLVAAFFDTHPSPGVTYMGWVMLVMSVVLGVAILAFVGAVIFAGLELRKARRYGFCFAMAVIQCLHLPWGTLLGVFTIVALNKPEAKQLFGVM